MAAGEIPSLTDAIAAGLRWRPEPFADGEHFDLGAVAARRGWGDCDDLAPWLVAEMRRAGVAARPVVYRSGPGRYHVVVRDGDGRIHDPSRWAGMGRRGARADGVTGALARPMLPVGEAGMALVRHGDRWHCRADVPWPRARAHVASLGRSRTIEGAVDMALSGVACVSPGIGLDATDMLVMGETALDPEVGLFGFIKKAAKAASSFVPGGRAAFDAAEAIEDMAAKGGKKSGKGRGQATPPGAPVELPRAAPESPSWMAYHPQGYPGPVVIRMAP
jgi:hypothetical protein